MSRKVDEVVGKVSESIGGFEGERPPKGSSVVFKTIYELSPEIHQNALDHGWHEGYIDSHVEHSAKLMQIVGEIGEANDCLAHGQMDMTYREDGKPEGLPSEIADIVIRAIDLAHLDKRQDVCEEICDAINGNNRCKAVGSYTPEALSCNLMGMTADLCSEGLAGVLWWAMLIASTVGFDLLEVMNIKHNYNKTRSYRHGGKLV